jgi:hypothetical protein
VSEKVVVAMVNGIHSDISTRVYDVGPITHSVGESVTGDTQKDPWYTRIGQRLNGK